VVGTFKETGSGVKVDRVERRKVLSLAQRREIDTVLVTELSRWGRSTTDLLATLKELEARRVSVIALNGMAFDLGTPHGRMIATVLAGIAEFERELKIGDASVRTALYEAANVILTRPVKGSSLKSWAMRVAKRAGMRKAKVALARKLAVVLHRMLVDGTRFTAAAA